MDVHYRHTPSWHASLGARVLRGVLAAAACVATSLPAQESERPRTRGDVDTVAVRWVITAPVASTAWFALLAELRLAGAGAFPFVETTVAARRHPLSESLAPSLARSREFEVLHFVPLYYPSADRTALAAAVRAASATPARAPVPRAELVVAALVSSISADARREYLPALASALEAMRPVPPVLARLSFLQSRLDAIYLPALAPWLRSERLDIGRLIISDAIGAEGRIFSGTRDRDDNLIAVGATSNDADPEAPLLAYTRELCYPAVTRAARARGVSATEEGSARRASLATVRCGADLLAHLLPARVDAYRAFWLRRAGHPGDTARFDAVFPPDHTLRVDVAASLGRVAGTPR